MSNDVNYGDFTNTKETGILKGGVIHENVLLKKVEYVNAISKENNPYEALKFYYVKDGKNTVDMLSDQLLKTNKASLKNWDHTVDLDTTYNEQIQKFNDKVKHIALAFVTLDDIKAAFATPVSSFKEFCDVYINMLAPHLMLGGNPVRLKVTLDNSNYSKVPDYPKFIQSMKEESNLVFTNKEKERLDKIRGSVPKEKADAVIFTGEDEDDDEFIVD